MLKMHTTKKVELVGEYAKEMIYHGSEVQLGNQIYLLGNQYRGGCREFVNSLLISSIYVVIFLKDMDNNYVAKTVKPMSIVSEQLLGINEVLENTYSKCKNLEDKLSMVLSPEQPDKDVNGCGAQSEAPIITQLDQLSMRIKAINTFLADITERVVC